MLNIYKLDMVRPLDDSSSPVMADILTDVVMMDHFGGRVTFPPCNQHCMYKVLIKCPDMIGCECIDAIRA